MDLTEEMKATIREMVVDWIAEGFTSPPYSEVQHDVFRWLGIENVSATHFGAVPIIQAPTV